jgi:hypothetical protein
VILSSIVDPPSLQRTAALLRCCAAALLRCCAAALLPTMVSKRST